MTYIFDACKNKRMEIILHHAGTKTIRRELFTNFQPSDRVPEDNFYRKLKEILDLRFVPDSTARPYYDKIDERLKTPYTRKMKKLGRVLLSQSWEHS